MAMPRADVSATTYGNIALLTGGSYRGVSGNISVAVVDVFDGTTGQWYKKNHRRGFLLITYPLLG